MGMAMEYRYCSSVLILFTVPPSRFVFDDPRARAHVHDVYMYTTCARP